MEQIGVKSDISKLQQLLGSKLYSDKYSFIQEQMQNSTDAMRKCGKGDEPFHVGIKKDTGVFTFFIRDFGCSFESIDDFKRLIGTLLESSKSQQKDASEGQELGKYGIGSIACAAYNKEWNYKVYKNGKGFDANLKEIDGKGLFLGCSDYYETEEVDGVYFEVEINTEINEFYDKLIQKAKYFQNIKFVWDSDTLAYFKSKYFDVSSIIDINQRFKIVRSEDFQYSTLNELNEMHICLDQYSYFINWTEAGINRIKLPIALRFSLNEFETNPTREVITIDESYKEKIRNKVKKVAKYFLDKYNEENPVFEAENLKIYEQELIRRDDKSIKIANKVIDIEEFCKTYTHGSFNLPTFKNITPKTLDDFHRFMNFYGRRVYNVSYKIRRGTLLRNTSLTWNERSTFILTNRRLKRFEQDYLKTKNDTFYIIEKSKNDIVLKHDGINPSIQTHFNIEERDINSEHEKMFEDFKLLKEEHDKNVFLKIEDIIPKDYENTLPKKEKKKKEKVEKSEEEIFLKYPRRPERSCSWFAVWQDAPVKMKNLSRLPKLHIYGTESKRKDLESLYVKFQKKDTNLQIIMVSEKTEKMLKQENNHNFIHIDDLKNNFGVISKYATMGYIKSQVSDIENILKHHEIIKTYISKQIGDDMNELDVLLKKYDPDDIFYGFEKTIIKEIVDFYNNNPKLYDQNILDKANKVLRVASKLDFVTLFAHDIKTQSSRKDIAIKTMNDICRFRQVRMNWENYILDKIEPVKQVVIVEEEAEV